MIRVSHVRMPAGLSALAWREAHDEVTVLVSDALGPAQQRAAVRLALAASRRGWRAALLPLPVTAVLAASQSWLWRIARALREHAVATAAVATVAAASAALVIAAAVHAHGPAAAARFPEPGQVQVPPAGQQSSQYASPGRGGQGPSAARPHSPGALGPPGPGTSPAPSSVPGHRPSPGPGPSPRPDPSPQPGHSPTPSPSTSSGPAPSPSSPQPSPKPSPKPSPTPPPGHGHCVWLLGILVCL